MSLRDTGAVEVGANVTSEPPPGASTENKGALGSSGRVTGCRVMAGSEGGPVEDRSGVVGCCRSVVGWVAGRM